MTPGTPRPPLLTFTAGDDLWQFIKDTAALAVEKQEDLYIDYGPYRYCVNWQHTEEDKLRWLLEHMQKDVREWVDQQTKH